MRLNINTMLVLLLTILVSTGLCVNAISGPAIYHAEQPPTIPKPPMAIRGYVHVTDMVTKNNFTVPGLQVKVFYSNTQIYPLEGSQNITDSTGYYALYIANLQDDTPIDIFVETINVTRVLYRSLAVLDLNLTVIDTIPPTKPTNLTLRTDLTNRTPAFSWNASNDNFRLKGYYVKIVKTTGEVVINKTFIGNVTYWVSTQQLDWGEYKFVVWAVDIANNEGPEAEITFRLSPLGAPIVRLTANVTETTVPAVIRFDVQLVNLSRVDQILMSFGDGTIENVTNNCRLSNNMCSFTVVRTYTTPGSYRVWVNVTGLDLSGALVRINASVDINLYHQGTVTRTVTITEPSYVTVTVYKTETYTVYVTDGTITPPTVTQTITETTVKTALQTTTATVTQSLLSTFTNTITTTETTTQTTTIEATPMWVWGLIAVLLAIVFALGIKAFSRSK